MGKSFQSKTKKLCVLGVFTALAVSSLFLIKFQASFLTFDLKDTFLLLSAMVCGPISGIFTSLVSALIEMLLLSDTGIYGFIMNFVSSATFAFTAAYIYSKRRTMSGAVLGLITSSLITTVEMLLLNLVITPLYMKCSLDDVVLLIPSLLLPFNIIKYAFNSSVTMLLYKPLTSVLKKTKLMQGETNKNTRTSVLVIVVTLIISALCILSLVLFMNGALSL